MLLRQPLIQTGRFKRFSSIPPFAFLVLTRLFSLGLATTDEVLASVDDRLIVFLVLRLTG